MHSGGAMHSNCQLSIGAFKFMNVRILSLYSCLVSLCQTWVKPSIIIIIMLNFDLLGGVLSNLKSG